MLNKMSVVDVIRHYQRSIEKCGDDEKRMLHCINKLCRLPITVQHLKETGVGRTVNALRKYDGQVGEAAKYTVTKWKQMVADEESSEDDHDAAAAEAYQENVTEECEGAEEEDGPDDEYKSTVIKDNTRHSHRESHSKSRSDDNHKSHNKSEHKLQKEKSQTHVDQNKKKHKDRHKYENLNHAEGKQSHKRKSNSSKNNEVEEKRRKYESDNENLSEDDSESQGMQIDEETNEDNCAVAGSGEDLEEEDEEEQQEREDSDDNDSDNRGSNSDSSNRLKAPSHKHNSKHHSSSSVSHHSSSSSAHHSKHHKESHRKHEKHKEKKSSSSEKHSKKTDSDKVNERTSSSNHKDKHSKHKDSKHEHKSSKHKSSSSNSGESSKDKGHIKHKTGYSVKDSESQVEDKKKTKEKTESVEKSSSTSKHHKSSNKAKESKDRKRKKVLDDDEEEDDDDGITATSGTSFAEALGMVDPLIKKKTSSAGTSSSSKATRITNSKTAAVSEKAEKNSSKSKEMKPPKAIPPVKEEPELLSSNVKLEPLKVDLDSTLPEISPNYRPLPHPNMDAFPQRKTKTMSDEDALAVAMSQKNQRTKVYSGMRSGKSWSSVPTLFDICVRVLQEHIDAIEYTGGVPYDLLKPILTIATPEQLFTLEDYNPYLIEDTDELWEFHCKKSFRTKQREDLESWREMYVRCVEEREAKLKALTSNIQQSIAKSTPVRQTKLAYVDSVVKPPRNVAKQQAKYGTANASASNKGSPQKGPKPGVSGHSAAANLSGSSAPVPVPPPRGVPPVAKVKPRMAPLMQKTMKLVKSFKR